MDEKQSIVVRPKEIISLLLRGQANNANQRYFANELHGRAEKFSSEDRFGCQRIIIVDRKDKNN